ncbi:MAG: tRNA (cytidine(56)-2'-O)-methyltransferase [Halobacteria archaeon]|nr:tRNA (cytidine(56)-2'-O)-methyltransferase [Halobacteria archaeon]
MESSSGSDGERCAEVLRLGHRPQRDERMTSHVGLTARALGGDKIYLATSDSKPKETVDNVTERFGGDFETVLTEKPRKLMRDWDGVVVHLTMYGQPVQDVIDEVRTDRLDKPTLAVVGSQKVSWDVYETADYNVGVTNQPHSEVAALAVFLHEYFEGEELERKFQGGEVEVVPSEKGKEMREL